MIESLENKKIKEVVRLKNKKYRDSKGLFIVETSNLVDEAKKNNCLLEVYSLNSYDFDNSYIVSESVMKKISDLDSTSILGVCKKIDSLDIVGDRVLLLDEIQDPGNLGTIIRSALAFNVSCVVLGDGCCDLYNSKAIRASEGSIFYVPVIRMNIGKAISEIKNMNIPVYATDVTNGYDINTISSDKYAIIMGNEGNGVKREYQDLADKNIYIKTNPNSESLNVAIATSIILYELDK